MDSEFLVMRYDMITALSEVAAPYNQMESDH